jgi:galactonate dehydratase
VADLKVRQVETHLVGANWRNFVFVRVLTDDGLGGVGEATIEWQPEAVAAAVRQLAERHLVGRSAFEIEGVWQRMYRDEFIRGDAVLLSAIGGIEIALWDIIGQALGEPIHRLLGGPVRESLPAYANGWYRGERRPDLYADQARAVVGQGYRALKFDPFGANGREMPRSEFNLAVDIIGAVREAVGPDVELLIECHGRFSPPQAIELGRAIDEFRPYWIEEPTDPENIAALEQCARGFTTRLATGERSFGKYQTFELLRRGFVDVLQTDLVHSGGILETKKIAAMADACFIPVAPHNPYGPVAEMATLHLDSCTTNVFIQESFSEFDVEWRGELVEGAPQIRNGTYSIPDRPGLGLQLNLDAVAEHPYDAHAFLPMWREAWADRF